MKNVALSVIAAFLAILVGAVPVGATASTQSNITFSSYAVEATLGRDSENRSTLSVTETIVASFAQPNINHGIERKFVKNYDGHDTELSIESVTNGDGKALEYEMNGATMRIGDADEYVSGIESYVIKYTQRDVTKFYSDTDKDEFYWDMIGVENTTRIVKPKVSLTVDESLRSAIKTDVNCYYGASGSTKTCEVSQSSAGAYEADLTGLELQAGEGVTFALGFEPGTFAEYQEPLWRKALVYGSLALPICVMIYLFVRSLSFRRKYSVERAAAKHVRKQAVAPEYIPPKDYSVFESAIVLGVDDGKMVTAQIIDWAVRHFVDLRKISKNTYSLVIKRSLNETLPSEQKIAKLLLKKPDQIGHTRKMSEISSDSGLQMRLQKERKEVVRSKLFLDNRDEEKFYGGFLAGTIIFFVSIIAIVISLEVYNRYEIFIGLGLMFFAAVLCLIGYSIARNRKSVEGEELLRYLKGLRVYIKAAEAEQLRMLQSPDGAEKVGDISSDKGALVRLYERCLPYAILFGEEKKWAKKLVKLYEESYSSPSWTSDSLTSNALLVGYISGLHRQASTIAFSGGGSSSISSFGGSGGGGFSGGGGGGGGAGGW